MAVLAVVVSVCGTVRPASSDPCTWISRDTRASRLFRLANVRRQRMRPDMSVDLRTLLRRRQWMQHAIDITSASTLTTTGTSHNHETERLEGET